MAQPFMNPNYYNPYQQQVQPHMDRLAQLQAQQYQSQQYPTQAPQINQQPQATQSWAYVQGEAAAEQAGMSLNKYIIQAIEEKISHDKGRQ